MFDISFLNITGHVELETFVQSVLSLAISLSAIVTVVSLIISGFKFMISGGDEEKIKSAQKSLIFSILGLILVFLSPTVIQFVLTYIAKL